MPSEASSNADGNTSKQPAIPPETRIRELSAIDADIASLLRSAGLAIKSLSSPTELPGSPQKQTTPDAKGDSDDDSANDSEIENPTNPLTAAKATFSTHNTAYLHELQSIEARLRRQAYALEEAGIILPTAPVLDTGPISNVPGPQSNVPPQKKKEVMQVTNGGLGKFDVGWLNSRRDEVGKRKEGELWREARVLVEGFEGREAGKGGEEDGGGRDDMDVDEQQDAEGEDD